MDKKRDRGFTLVDVLLAILVMTIGFIGLQAVQITGLSANALARELTEASLVGRQVVERLKAQSLPGVAVVFNDTVDARGCDVAAGPAYCNPPLVGARYNRTWSVTPQGVITVTVQWQSGDNKDHRLVFNDGR